MHTAQCAIQMNSVLPSAHANLPATLRRLAEIGYDGVEFAMRFGGFFGRTAMEMRRLLNDTGLRCTGATFDGMNLEGDALKIAADDFAVLGGKYLIQANLAVASDQIHNSEAWRRTAEAFTVRAERLQAYGLQAGLHNHTEEWVLTTSGECGWEIIFANTPASFVQELDTCHCMEGGGDPVKMLRAFPGRSQIVHLKEYPRGTDDPSARDDPAGIVRKLCAFGAGRVPWSDVLAACRGVGGTEWYAMEFWMGSAPLDGQDLENAGLMLSFARRIFQCQAAAIA